MASTGVSNTAQVFGNARVFENALVFGNARVYGDARVFGSARVYGDARVMSGYIGAGADVFQPHHAQVWLDREGVLWTVYRTAGKPRIMRWSTRVKRKNAPAVVQAIYDEVGAVA